MVDSRDTTGEVHVKKNCFVVDTKTFEAKQICFVRDKANVLSGTNSGDRDGAYRDCAHNVARPESSRESARSIDLFLGHAPEEHKGNREETAGGFVITPCGGPKGSKENESTVVSHI